MNIIGKFVGMWTSPWKSIETLKSEGLDASIKPSLTFVVIMGLLAGIVTAIIGAFSPAPIVAGEIMPKWLVWLSIVIVPIASLIGSFLGAFLVWALVTGLLFGNATQYKSIYRILAALSAFSPVTAAIASIPKVGSYIAIGINIWALIILIKAIIVVLDTKPVRTAVTLGVAFGLLFLLGFLARISTENALRNQAGASDFGNMNDSFMNTAPQGTDDMGAKLDELANQAKDAAKTNPPDKK